MQNHYYFYLSPNNNPHHTLAVEEYMMNHVSPGDVILYLYIHSDSIIIGKNQNAWAECRHEQLGADGGILARRVSGGGAVFHDMENLNFSFIVGRETYDLHRQLKVMLAAAKMFGIDAEFSGRNDILADGRKFSGNAFCFRKNGAFHHGTILINTDMTKLSKYLAVPKDKIESKGIASVRSRVVNLAELNPQITPESMTQALKKSFAAEYGEPQEYPFTQEAWDEIARIEERNAGWDWLFGQTPQFDITIKTRFAWGGIELLLKTKDAVIEDATLYSDAMDADFMASIPNALKGSVFRSQELAERLRSLPETEEQKQITDDIAAYIVEQGY
ncbi:lipoate--protein ligase [Christensenella hongkongensis]|uniref:lipoate--protein ligase n=1 Tax=Christensenella hongkongensis TaxID=270498 RepID=UPI002673D1D8|nr:lipoate--protein ligase [Christensenella hongkongensis]